MVFRQRFQTTPSRTLSREHRWRIMRYTILLAITISSATAAAQPVPLSYRPVTAAYSTALDRLIMVSGNPNALHIYDPVSQTDVTVNLVQPPLSLSISPDGLRAAVGHNALLTYVNLSTASVIRTF